MKISSWTHATSTLNYFWYFAVLGFSTSSCPAALNTHHSTSVVYLTTARPLDCRFSRYGCQVPWVIFLQTVLQLDDALWPGWASARICKDLPKLQAGWKPKVESAMCNLCQNPSKIPVCGIWAPARRFEVASSGYFCHKVDLTAVAGWGVLLGTCLAYLSHDSSVMTVMILFFSYMYPFLVCYLNVLLFYLCVACNLWFSFMFQRVQMIYPSR